MRSFADAGELACVVTHPDYRNGDRAERLLGRVEQSARSQGLSRLFALTTQSADWFRERGFVASDLDDLPAAKQELYNYQRNSTILVKTL